MSAVEILGVALGSVIGSIIGTFGVYLYYSYKLNKKSKF